MPTAPSNPTHPNLRRTPHRNRTVSQRVDYPTLFSVGPFPRHSLPLLRKRSAMRAIDFAQVRRQISMEQVLALLHFLPSRAAVPIYAGRVRSIIPATRKADASGLTYRPTDTVASPAARPAAKSISGPRSTANRLTMLPWISAIGSAFLSRGSTHPLAVETPNSPSPV